MWLRVTRGVDISIVLNYYSLIEMGDCLLLERNCANSYQEWHSSWKDVPKQWLDFCDSERGEERLSGSQYRITLRPFVRKKPSYRNTIHLRSYTPSYLWLEMKKKKINTNQNEDPPRCKTKPMEGRWTQGFFLRLVFWFWGTHGLLDVAFQALYQDSWSHMTHKAKKLSDSDENGGELLVSYIKIFTLGTLVTDSNDRKHSTMVAAYCWKVRQDGKEGVTWMRVQSFSERATEGTRLKNIKIRVIVCPKHVHNFRPLESRKWST